MALARTEIYICSSENVIYIFYIYLINDNNNPYNYYNSRRVE